MRKGKTNLILVAVLATLLGGMIWSTASLGADAKLAQVVYITRSKACGCSAKSVQAADALVNQTFTGPQRALLQRIDYDTDRQAAVPYIGEYHLIPVAGTDLSGRPEKPALDGRRRGGERGCS